MLDIFTIQTTSANPDIVTTIYTVILSFLLSTMVALTYEKTFRGLSYSRNFVQSLIMVSIVAATVMQAIGDSLASGLGMMGALAIIRFRTSLKDPRDIVFMFASLAAGISCGVNAYNTAVFGTLGFCFVGLILYFSPIGNNNAFDGMLRFNVENKPETKSDVDHVLNSHCRVFALITLRDLAQGNRLDYAYHIKMKKDKNKADLIERLKDVPSIKGLNLMLQETTVEI